MSGTFAQWQPFYAERGIATFPVKDKKPAVRGFLKIGCEVSRDLVRKFPDHDALGFALGTRSNITVLDIDSPDEGVLADAISRHGPSPIIVRSGSGNFHVWYRHSDERRSVRPWPEYPIDVLGKNGFVVAPPSCGTRRSYEFIQGSLDDVAHLPELEIIDQDRARLTNGARRLIDVGKRNPSLWEHCMRQARYCDCLDDLIDVARTLNGESLVPPLKDDEVIRCARSAWKYTERGENWFGQRGVRFSTEEVLRFVKANQDALLLLTYLKAMNGPHSRFIVANGLANELGWTVKRLAAARNSLLESHLQMIKGPSSKTGPAVFVWQRKNNQN